MKASAPQDPSNPAADAHAISGSPTVRRCATACRARVTPPGSGRPKGKSDTFDRAIGECALAYADQNAKDHAALVAAVKAGRIKALVEEE